MAFLSALSPEDRSKINSTSAGIKGILESIDKLKHFIAISKKSWLKLFYENGNVFIGLYTDNPELPRFLNLGDTYCWSLTNEWVANTTVSCFLKTSKMPEVSEAKFYALARIEMAACESLKKIWIDNVAEIFAPMCPDHTIEVYVTIDNKPRKGFYVKPWKMARKIDAGIFGPRFIVANDASYSTNSSAFEMGIDNMNFTMIVRNFDIDEMPFDILASLSGKVETFAFEYIETPRSPFRVTAFRPIEATAIREDDTETPHVPTTEYFLGEIPASVIETAMDHIGRLQVAPQMTVELLRLGMPEYFARRFVGFEPFKGFAGLNHSRARKIMVLFSKIVSLVMSTAAANWPEDKMPMSWTVGIFSEVTDMTTPYSVTSSQFASLSAENWSNAKLNPPRTSKAVPRIVESGRAIVPSTGSPLPPSYVVALNLADQTISNPVIKDSTLKSILIDAVVDIVTKDLNLDDRSKLSFLTITASDYLDTAPAPAAAPAAAPASMPAAPASVPASAPAARRKTGDRFSTVKLAWDSIESQYPECRNASEETRRLKLKSIESEIRGNRFAKPPKGTCGAGGNNRDFRSKVPHLLREMQEAAYSGVSKHDFYHLLSITDIFYTKNRHPRSRRSRVIHGPCSCVRGSCSARVFSINDSWRDAKSRIIVSHPSDVRDLLCCGLCRKACGKKAPRTI
jgi:hypothetical protein